MLVVFYFHNARFFDFEDWHVKNEQVYIGFMMFVAFTWQWIMPIFFFVSGAATLFALRYKSRGRYVTDRFKRLAIPYIMGIFIIIPPQKYVEALSHGTFNGSYLDFYRDRFRFDYIAWNFSFLGYYGHHLWFIGLLFFISLAALPLLLYLKKEAGRRIISQFAAVNEKWGGVFLFVIPIAVVQVALRAKFPGESNWAEFFYYGVFFISGYVVFSDKRFERAIEKHGTVALLIGSVCFSIMAVWYFAGDLKSVMDNPSYSAPFIALQLLASLDTWCWIVFILSLCMKFLDFRNRGLEYANEAVLPFYILHQTVILLIGFYVVQWNMGVLAKFLLISTASFVATLALYDFVVKRFSATRFLFGMRPKKR